MKSSSFSALTNTCGEPTKRGVLLQRGGAVERSVAAVAHVDRRDWEEVKKPPLRRVDLMVARGAPRKHAFGRLYARVHSRTLNVADRSKKEAESNYSRDDNRGRNHLKRNYRAPLRGFFHPFGKYRLEWPLKMVRNFLRE